MRVLVSGGAGFIGSHVVERLLARGDEVLVIDDFSTGRSKNLSEAAGHPSLEVVRGSVCDEAQVSALVERADAVIHLAAAVGVRLAMEQTVHTIENNVTGTRHVLLAAARQRKRTLLASSSEVYGRSTRAPFREDAPLELGPTSSPRWSYACSKALDEWLALALFRERGLPVTALRFFNVVGPRQSAEYGMVLPRFVERALEGAPLPVHGDGEQTRSFTDVRDAVSAVLRLLDQPRAAGRVVNVGAANEVSILDLAKLVLEVTRSSSAIEHIAADTLYGGTFDDTRRRAPDLSLLQELIGFVPSSDLAGIVADVVAHARELSHRG